MSSCSELRVSIRRVALLAAVSLTLAANATATANAQGTGKTTGKTPPKTTAKTAKTPAKDSAAKAPGSAKKPDVSRFFKGSAPIEVVFTANFRQLRKEKTQTAPWHVASIAYTDSAGGKVTIPIRAKTRGVWRLNNCEFPPLKLDFPDKLSKNTLFDDLEEPKLVSYCKAGGEASDQLVLQELQLYRMLHVLTPISHKTRLLRVTFADSATGKTEMTRWSFLVEDDKRMVERLGMRLVERKGAGEDDLDPGHTALAFLFQYMIGNTDFSWNSLHNAEIVTTGDGRNFPVPYDFDFAGAVNAPYAAPAPNLRIRNVRDRQFRGFCSGKAEYPAVIELFRARKAELYALYSDSVGALIKPSTVKATLEYYDKFYESIETPKKVESNLFSECTKGRV